MVGPKALPTSLTGDVADENIYYVRLLCHQISIYFIICLSKQQCELNSLNASIIDGRKVKESSSNRLI